VNNLPKVVAQQRHGRASNPRPLDRKSDALPLSHRATSRLHDTPKDFEISAYVSLQRSIFRIETIAMIPTEHWLVPQMYHSSSNSFGLELMKPPRQQSVDCERRRCSLSQQLQFVVVGRTHLCAVRSNAA